MSGTIRVSANIQNGAEIDCDKNNMDTCAEIAANMIDDFYDDKLGDNGLSMDASNGYNHSI